MLIEAAKGGHTNVVSYLLDYPNNILSVPAPDLSQLTPPSQDASQVPPPSFHGAVQGSVVESSSLDSFRRGAGLTMRPFPSLRFLVSHSKLWPWWCLPRSPTEPHQTSPRRHPSPVKVTSKFLSCHLKPANAFHRPLSNQCCL